MNKTTILFIAAILIVAFIGVVIAAPLVANHFFPTTYTAEALAFTNTWASNGTMVTAIQWGVLPNNTATALGDLVNVTNTGTVPFTLALGYTSPSLSLISLSLDWNYTGSTVNVHESLCVQINATASYTASGSWTTWINATQS